MLTEKELAWFQLGCAGIAAAEWDRNVEILQDANGTIDVTMVQGRGVGEEECVCILTPVWAHIPLVNKTVGLYALKLVGAEDHVVFAALDASLVMGFMGLG